MKQLWASLKERLTLLAPKVGYPIFYVFCLILFFSWTFPYERLKERIVVAFNAGQRAAGSTQELQIEDASSSWITGVTMTNIRLGSPPAEPGKPASEIKIEEATLRMSLLGLLVGNRDVTFHVSAFGGKVDGSYDDRGKEKDIDVDIKGVAIGQVAPVAEAFGGLPVGGTLDGSIKLDFPEDKEKAPGPPKTSGSVSLEVTDMAIGDGKAKIKIPLFGELTVPRLNVGTFSLAGDAKDGVLTLKKFGAGGKDLELQGDGRLQLREQMMDTGLDVNVRVKVNDAYRGKTDMTKSVFGAPGSTAPPIFDNIEIKKGVAIKQAKRPDGFYAWHFRGPLGKPDYTPAGNALGSPFPPRGGGP